MDKKLKYAESILMVALYINVYAGEAPNAISAPPATITENIFPTSFGGTILETCDLSMGFTRLPMDFKTPAKSII